MSGPRRKERKGTVDGEGGDGDDGDDGEGEKRAEQANGGTDVAKGRDAEKGSPPAEIGQKGGGKSAGEAHGKAEAEQGGEEAGEEDRIALMMGIAGFGGSRKNG